MDDAMEGHEPRRLLRACGLLAVGLGLAHAWIGRQVMGMDGISYLDMADAHVRGQWGAALNGLWSPLYSWLLGLALLALKPSPEREFPMVHLVNFLIYLGTLGAFQFFLAQLLGHHRREASRHPALAALPAWAIAALGYALFLWSSLSLIGIATPSPDLCLAAVVYLASAVILRIQSGSANWTSFLLLGLILGCGYLAKAVLFPLGFVFLGVAAFSSGPPRSAAPRALAALLAFLVVCGPYVLALSRAKGHWTFSEAGKLNYAWRVNGIPLVHWQGGPAGSGAPRHPTRKIFDAFPVYEFAAPVGGTYPPWYDPSYWYDGLVLRFDLAQQLRVLGTSLKTYYGLFVQLLGPFVAGLLILVFIGGRRRLWLADTARHWTLLVPAAAALGLYSLVRVELRYVAPFVVLLWLGILCGVRLPASAESGKLMASASVMILILMALRIAGATHRAVVQAEAYPASQAPQVAEGLGQMGVRPGDKVAYFSYLGSLSPIWARRARVQVVVEGVFRDTGDEAHFWTLPPPERAWLLETIAASGAKALVIQRIPTGIVPAGWQRIDGTTYCYYMPGPG